MIIARNALRAGFLAAIGMTAAGSPASAQAGPASTQAGDEASCGQKLTQQLRRFNERCVGEAMAFAATLPQGSATIYSEKDKYFVKLSKAGTGLQGEAVSKQNYPLMTDETAGQLKALGWMAPDVEFGGFKKTFSDQDIRSGAAAQEVAKALRAYGMAPGDAIALTVSDHE